MISRERKQIALLVDPENTFHKKEIEVLVEASKESHLDYFFVGGSLVTHNHIDQVVTELKRNSKVPVVLFPGGLNQISEYADGILFLSLISGRNPDYLISKQVAAAPLVKKLGITVVPTGYMLIGEISSASYMSSTTPIPYGKTDIAVATAIAGELMGNKVIYLDAGSGAKESVRLEMISEVRKAINIPLIIGGGIRDFDSAYAILEAGADMIVVGNATEKNPRVIQEISGAVRAMNNLNVH
jgi:phosphoglycerol geranylgeranyltransferase